MFCDQCGAAVTNDHAKFCTACGAPTQPAGAPDLPRAKTQGQTEDPIVGPPAGDYEDPFYDRRGTRHWDGTAWDVKDDDEDRHRHKIAAGTVPPPDFPQANHEASDESGTWQVMKALFSFPGTTSSQIICPHCQARGQVTTRETKVKRGVSGGKATGAVLTGGLSLLATGLSRKQPATEAHCGNCGMSWVVEG